MLNMAWSSASVKGISAVLTAMAVTTVSVPAGACSLMLPPVEDAVREVASTGYLISGTVVQPLDAAKRQPEIIMADRIFVGEGAPRQFKIYRTEDDYLRHAKAPGVVFCRGRAFTKAGFKWEQFVLIPAPKQDDGSTDDQWILYWNEGSVTRGKGYELFLAEAKQLGRLKERPPANRWFDD